MCSKIYLLLIFLLTLLQPSVHAVSWYANIGSWEIQRQSENVSFSLEDYYSGDITGIEVTPNGRKVTGGHLRHNDIDLNDVRIKQRRSAFQGAIKSEEYTDLSAETVEPITRDIIKPSGSPFYIFNFAELWPVHLQSDKAIVYRGSGINDLDLSENNLDYAETNFLYATELSCIRSCNMEFEGMNATVIADDEDVIRVEILPIKHINYSIESFSIGLMDLKYRQIDLDAITPIESGSQSYYGEYTLNATIRMSTASRNFDVDDGSEQICCLPGSGQIDEELPMRGSYANNLFKRGREGFDRDQAKTIL